jgi:putative flippase GtrA
MQSNDFINFLFKKQTDNTILQLFRYTFVGGFAFLIDFSTLYILTDNFKVHYLLAGGVSFILGLIANYILSVKWVFNSKKVENRFLEFILFTLIGMVGLGLNELFLWILTDLLLIYYLLSKIVTTFLIYFWNFFARKYILFNK